LEKWIETRRIKGQPLTSPMTKELMPAMYFAYQFVKSQVGVVIKELCQEWVATRKKKKGGN